MKCGLISSRIRVAPADYRVKLRILRSSESSKALLIYLIPGSISASKIIFHNGESRMTYATVMVSLALDQPNDARLGAAGQVAERFDAAIFGIAASQFSPPLYFTSGQLAQDLIDEGRASIKKRIEELEGQFREAVKKRARQVEWR